ncbi:aldo/keto reductase [Sodalis sp. RH21]|uniref:aldo/keto reductase n=1 Tax=unclassified Sodalis (in: enterobacteria) TaxID=2636512 RepID=UPI0039B39F74
MPMLTRRRLLRFGAACGILGAGGWFPYGADAAIPQPTPGAPPMPTRLIPSSREALPVIGLGTYRGFDADPGSAAYARLPGVLDALLAAGGSVVDSSPMYGRAERTLGELLAVRQPRPPVFIATKVWTTGRAAGIRQMNDSFRLLQTERIDLMQIHNLLDWQTHLATLRDMKAAGRIRYVGVTHYSSAAYDELEAVLKSTPLDFLQINYALDDRAAERRLLPVARDRGVAVICNTPFGGGGLLRRLAPQPLPAWAKDVGAASWAQLALKFILANPAITCVIPGTGNPQYMAENAAAATGPALTPQQIRALLAFA